MFSQKVIEQICPKNLIQDLKYYTIQSLATESTIYPRDIKKIC